MHNKIDYLQYLFNFGENLNFQCNGKTAMIVEVLIREDKPTDICKVLAEKDILPFYSLINKNNFNEGIYVTFYSNEKCGESDDSSDASSTRKTRFKIICNKQQSNVIHLI